MSDKFQISEQDSANISFVRRSAEALFAQGDFQEAVKILLALQSSYPLHPGILNDLGVIYAQTGIPDLGLEYLKLALQFDPENEDAWVNSKAVKRIISETKPVDNFAPISPDAPKILFVAEYLVPEYGGAELSAIAILKSLRSEGYEITGVCKGERDREFWRDGIRFRHLTDVAKLQDSIEFEKQDLVLTQLNWAPAATFAAKNYHKPVFLFLRSYEHFCPKPLYMLQCELKCAQCKDHQENQIRLNEHRQMFTLADRIFANSQFMNQFQKYFYGREAEVVYPVIDFNKIVAPLHHPTFISAGRPAYEKGLLVFNSIIQALPHHRFLYFGRGGTFTLPDNAVYLGFYNPRIAYSLTKILLVPSLWFEPFGRLVLEAMANNIPVIASRIGGLPEAGGDAAMYIDNFWQTDLWVQNINKVLNDDGLYREMQAKGQERVKQFQSRPDLEHLKSVIRQTIDKPVKKSAPIEIRDELPARFTPLAEILPPAQNGKGCSLQIKTPYYLPLSETFIYNYFKNLKRFPPVILTHRLENREVFPLEHPLLTYQPLPAEDPNLQNFLRNLVEKYSIKLLHAHFGQVGAEIYKWADITGLPLITSFYGKDASVYLKDPEWMPLFHNLFSQTDAITVLSQEMKKRIIAAGCQEDKISIIHLGIDPDHLHLRKRKLHPGETVKFLCVGRLVEKKGFDDAIRALSWVKNSCKCQLRIIGEGPQEQILRELAKSLYVEKEVLFLGAEPQNYVKDEMNLCHIFLAPSKTASDGDQEGTPTVLMEAQALGMPVISTLHSGIPEVVENEATGFLVPEGDWQTLAEKMIYLIKHPEIWEKMGAEGRKKVESEFNVITETAKLEDLYQKVTLSHPQNPAPRIFPDLSLERNYKYNLKSSTETFHIAVDASALEDRGSRIRGIGRYVYNHFDHLIDLCPDWKFTFCGVTSRPNIDEVKALTERRNSSYLNWSDFHKLHPRIFYLSHPMYYTIPKIIQIAVLNEVPLVSTFYDLIPLIFKDLYLENSPDYKSFYLSQLENIKRFVRLILCDSRCTANDLNQRVGIPWSKLRVIYAGVTDHFSQIPSDTQIDQVLAQLGLIKNRFLLFTGIPDQRKNAFGCMKGFNLARQTLNQDLKLVFVGDIPDFLLDTLKKIEELCQIPPEAVIYSGFLSEGDLNALYHSALGLLFPSLYEGFGFPIVEAQAAGLPVIAGNNSSQPEVAGDGAILVNAANSNEIGDAVVKIFTDIHLRADLISKGKLNCQKFTWDKTAQKTAEFLQEFFLKEKTPEKIMNGI